MLDRAHLRRYTLDDRALEREILGLFAAQAEVTLDQLRKADNRQDWCFAAHSLKGSARAVGAWRLAGLAEACEADGAAGSGPPAACQSLVADVAQAVGEVNEAIARQFDQLKRGT